MKSALTEALETDEARVSSKRKVRAQLLQKACKGCMEMKHKPSVEDFEKFEKSISLLALDSTKLCFEKCIYCAKAMNVGFEWINFVLL